TILLVEDEPLVRQVARDALAGLGYEVLEARSGVEALEVLARREGPVHLLLTDAVLPQMSGREVARRVLAHRPDTRVLYVSGYSSLGSAPAGALGETSFLAKPFTPSGLASAVRAALDA
ncbi:MAG TPA: response regulator, partial [Planctomycetota bacterium]|nr:response regulator [Planctomycetota bacterium]